MSLREEIKVIIHQYKYTCTIPNEDFDEIINKVLDAAVEAVKTLDSYDEPIILEAINQLREQK